jgi:putative ABC transport system permease protein
MSAATLSSINSQPLQRINIGVVKLRPGSDPERVARELRPVVPSGAVAMTVADFVKLEKRFWSKETPIGFLFDIGAAIGFLISAIYTYQVLFQIVDENLSEYAVLKTMGYPNGFFTVLVMSTALILALTALPPAVLVSVGLYEICINATLLDLKLTMGRIVGVGAIATAIAIVSAWLAKRRLNHADPATLM